jgi:hypothetical protein
MLAQRRPKLQGTAAHLHVDNARAHTAKKLIREIKELGFIRVPHPSYSPDIAPRDCFLFDHLRDKHERMQFVNEDQVISAVIQVIKEIPLEMFGRVVDDSVDR